MSVGLTSMVRVAFCVFLATALAACGNQEDDAPTGPDMPRFDEQRLSQGRSVWMATCRNCHLLGIAGAPAVSDYQAWHERISKGAPALYERAINGVKDSKGQVSMPPRGGNARLTDEQVKMAVDYMIASVTHLSEDGKAK